MNFRSLLTPMVLAAGPASSSPCKTTHGRGIADGPTTSTLGRARAESPPTHGDRRDRIRAAQQARPSPPVVHIYAEPMAPEHRRVQQVFAADRTVFSVRRPDRHALLHQMLEAPNEIAGEIEDLLSRHQLWPRSGLNQEHVMTPALSKSKRFRADTSDMSCRRNQ